MFQIITNSTLPDIQIQDKQLVSVPCFYLTNNSTSTSISDLTNFAPMFTLESNDEEILESIGDIEDFSYVLSTIPSQYQMLEIDINPLDEISTLYINGSRYQNLLEIENLVTIKDDQDTLPLEEREST